MCEINHEDHIYLQYQYQSILNPYKPAYTLVPFVNFGYTHFPFGKASNTKPSGASHFFPVWPPTGRGHWPQRTITWSSQMKPETRHRHHFIFGTTPNPKRRKPEAKTVKNTLSDSEDVEEAAGEQDDRAGVKLGERRKRTAPEKVLWAQYAGDN